MRYECVRIIQKIRMIRKTSVSGCPFTDYFDTLFILTHFYQVSGVMWWIPFPVYTLKLLIFVILSNESTGDCYV